MPDVSFSCPQCGTNLQTDANNAGAQIQCPQCGNAIAVPPWAWGPDTPAAGAGRPASVTVFGVLSIVFGGLGLLCTPFALLGVFASPSTLPARSSEYTAWLVISSVIGLAAAGWLLPVGIGLLGLKRWGRAGAVAYGWFAIVFGILNTGITMAVLLSRDMPSTPEAVGGYVGGMCGGFLGLAYPILLLVFMTRPHVIAACNR